MLHILILWIFCKAFLIVSKNRSKTFFLALGSNSCRRFVTRWPVMRCKSFFCTWPSADVWQLKFALEMSWGYLGETESGHEKLNIKCCMSIWISTVFTALYLDIMYILYIFHHVPFLSIQKLCCECKGHSLIHITHIDFYWSFPLRELNKAKMFPTA